MADTSLPTVANPLPVSRALSGQIQAHIDAAQPDPLKSSAYYDLKHRYNALPIAANSIYIWAIRADGELLCMDHEAFARPCEREMNVLQIHAALASGARIYPELRTLRPARPLWAVPCRQCAPTGCIDSGKGYHEPCGACSGTGWVRRG